MPLVRVYDDTGFQQDTLKVVEALLRSVIAEELSCSDKGGELTPDDMEVFFLAQTPQSSYHLLIDIEAVNFPSRLANQQERSGRIKDRVAQALESDVRGVNVAVWLKLLDATWSEYLA